MTTDYLALLEEAETDAQDALNMVQSGDIDREALLTDLSDVVTLIGETLSALRNR